MASKQDGKSGSTPEAVLQEVDRKMDRAIDALKRELNTLRNCRDNPALIENISVDYYGTQSTLKQISSIHAPYTRANMVQRGDNK